MPRQKSSSEKTAKTAAKTGWDCLITDCHVATMAGDEGYGEIRDAAIAVQDGRIAWIGPEDDLPEMAEDALDEVTLNGAWVTPGLIDCHTHLVYGGQRANEFEMRLNGASYEEIAKAGGGIVSTVKATRAASLEDLAESAGRRLESLVEEGVTTIEIKSGYGLDLETERRMLQAARQLEADYPISVLTTCLAAHALPPEYAGRQSDYVDLVCETIIPTLAKEGLVDAVDAFCEKIAFTPAETERVFQTAQQLGLPVKLHAEQLSDQKGAVLAAKYHALSADHVEYVGEDGVEAMAKAGTIAVLLPGAFYCLRETKQPPIDLFRKHGVKMAVSTDSNPGTSPTLSLRLMLSMACAFFRLTPQEALRGVTINAAHALGIGDSHGSLEVGKIADLAAWQIAQPAELSYWIGGNPCSAVMKSGFWARRSY
jgi:imidazolonepropionase